MKCSCTTTYIFKLKSHVRERARIEINTSLSGHGLRTKRSHPMRVHGSKYYNRLDLYCSTKSHLYRCVGRNDKYDGQPVISHSNECADRNRKDTLLYITTKPSHFHKCADRNQLVFAIAFTYFFAPLQRCADRNDRYDGHPVISHSTDRHQCRSDRTSAWIEIK